VDEGITEPSSGPGFQRGIWYSYADGAYCSDYRTGEMTQLSGHLEGFTEDEQRKVYAGVMDALAQYRAA
jgi:hypothetical protein